MTDNTKAYPEVHDYTVDERIDYVFEFLVRPRHDDLFLKQFNDVFDLLALSFSNVDSLPLVEIIKNIKFLLTPLIMPRDERMNKYSE